MQVLDQVIWNKVLDDTGRIAFQGIPRTKEWRRKRIEKALRYALEQLGLEVTDL